MGNHIDIEIVDFIESLLSVKIEKTESINRGLLNLKWKVITNRGSYFVKKYHPIRYDEKKLKDVKTSLRYQETLNKLGIKCPKLYTYQDKILQKTSKGQYYILTDYLLGNLVQPGKINSSKAYHLGIETAKMHNFAMNFENKYINKGFEIPIRSKLIDKWNKNWLKVIEGNNIELMEAMEKQKKIFQNFDYFIFKSIKPSLAHNDLWYDNVLFHDESVSGILDFDRFHFSFVELDIARAILSFGLYKSYLSKDILCAFMNGYNEIRDLSIKDVIISLRLCYIRESLSWLSTDYKINNGPPNRFKEEMIWIGNHWGILEEVM